MGPKSQQKDKKSNQERVGGDYTDNRSKGGGESSTVTRPSRLNYVPTGQNNWFEFKRTAEVYFESKYGLAGLCLSNDAHWKPKEPKAPSAEALREDAKAGGLLKERYMHLYKRASDELARAQAEYPKMYADLWDLLTLGSQSVVKSHSGYAAAKLERDPLLLMRCIKATHEGSLVGTSEVDVVAANRRYYSMAQGVNEHTEAFKMRVEAALDSMRAAGCSVPGSEVQAHTYLSQLADNRYASLKMYLSNESAVGNDPWPKTLETAHALALRWKTSFVPPGKGPGGESAPDAVVLVETTGAPPPSHPPKDKSKGDKDRKSKNKEKEKKPKQSKRGGDDGCRVCGDPDHWVRDCPHVKSAMEAAKKKPRTGEAALVMLDHPGEQSHHDEVVFVCDGHCTGVCETCTPCAPPQDTVMVGSVGIGLREVLLDNQATANLFGNPALLTDLRQTHEPVHVQGVGGMVCADHIGDFGSFGPVHFSSASPANVLAFSVVRKMFYVSYDYVKDTFTVHLPEGGLVFTPYKTGSRAGYLYSYKVPEEKAMVQTVEERMKLYSKREVTAAEDARDLERLLGHPSPANLIKMINSGAIVENKVTAQDVRRAQSIWGPSVESLKGKTKTHASPRVTVEHVPAPVERELALHADILFVDGDPHLIVVAQPLGLTLTKHLSGRTAGVLESALADVINQLRARGFEPKTLLSDGEKGIAKVANRPKVNLVFNPAGPGMHVPIVENKIRQLKERMRAVLSGLPYVAPPFLVRWAVQYCVTRLNMVPSGTRVDPTSPRELFLGRKVNAKIDLRIGFGEYVQAHDPNVVKNSMAPRTMGAIALVPTGNLQGSVKFYCLATKSIVTRDQWKVLPAPPSVIATLDEMAGVGAAHRRKDPVFARGEATQLIYQEAPPVLAALPEPPRFVPTATEPAGSASDDPEGSMAERAVEKDGSPITESDVRYDHDDHYDSPRVGIDGVDQGGAAGTGTPEHRKEVTFAKEETQDLTDADELGIDDGVEPTTSHMSEDSDQDEEVVGEVPAPPSDSRYPKRQNRTSWREKSMDYGLHMSIAKAKQEYGSYADAAVDKEILQMLDLGVWKEVDPGTLNRETLKSVIFSLLFLKAKHSSEGEFQELKARLVANGSQQDKSVFDNVSSPTVGLASLFICAGIAAREGRIVTTMDIVGAYLKVDMGDKVVRVRLPAYVAARVVQLRPGSKRFLLRDGTMVVQLKKAMYGCVESARLLFLRVKEEFVKMGFVQNPYDECVFNKGSGADQCTIILYVDDIMITSVSQGAVDEVVQGVSSAFGTVKVHRSKVHSYLGMTMDFTEPGACRVSMDGYTADIIKSFGATGKSATPAGDNLFVVREGISPLDKSKKEAFHSAVAKALYLAKRVRPEILVAVSFLTTRVQQPDEDDWAKLIRLYKYLSGEPNLSLTLRFHSSMSIMAYVDAAFAVHKDMKSHTGGFITLGGGALAPQSTKQKIVTKSSTEAELVATSDFAGQFLERRNFLGAQGYEVPPVTLGQDNMSTIQLLKNGRTSSERTRHINIRYFFLKDRMVAGELVVVHVPTLDMVADILTKPLQGELFRKLRAVLLGI